MPYCLPEKSPSFDFYDEPRLHMEKLLKAHLIEFDISTRIVFPLGDHGIRSLKDLVSTNPNELAKIGNVGAKAIQTLKDFLAYHKLHFGMKIG